MERVWDCPSAAPSSNRTTAACGPLTTLRAARVFTSFCPLRSRHETETAMADRDDIQRYLENWEDEVDRAAEYRAMAAANPRLTKVYANLAAMEEAHVTFWEDRLRS